MGRERKEPERLVNEAPAESKKRKDSAPKKEKEAKKPKKEKKEKGAPGVRPLSGYLQYSKDSRAELLEEEPDLANTEIMKKLAEQWKELSKKEQDKYTEKAQKAWKAAGGEKVKAEHDKKKAAEKDQKKKDKAAEKAAAPKAEKKAKKSKKAAKEEEEADDEDKDAEAEAEEPADEEAADEDEE